MAPAHFHCDRMQKQQAFVMWIIWFGFLQMAFAYHFVLEDGFPSGDNAAEPMASWLWVLCFVPIILATIVRWWVIPKLKDQKQMLSALIVGLALTEASILFELFQIGSDYPQNQIAVLMVAVFSLIQFAPIYATPGVDVES
jgi:fatty acid desaturase